MRGFLSGAAFVVVAGGWLVFAAHDVSDFAQQAMPADVLDAVCRYCAKLANGIWIDTVAAVAAHVAAQLSSGMR